jgi:hypothetical protein
MVTATKMRRLAAEANHAHVVADITVDTTADPKGVMTAVRLEDGRRLLGITNARMQLAPDGKTVRLVLELVGEMTVNGKSPTEAFQRAADPPRVQEVTAGPLVDKDGRPLS